MRRVYVLVLLVIFAGCCGLFAESAADAIARATAMREAGDFKGAADILGAAMKSPQLSPVQQKDLSLQLDMLRRLKLDYSLSRDELYNDLTGAVKDLTPQEYSGWIDQGRFDSRTIDGQAQFVNTSVNNLFFRYPELRVRRIHDKNTVPEQRGRYLDCLAIQIAALQQRSPYVLPHYFLCTMTVTTHPDAVPESGKKDGELIRAWLPIPREYPYQNQFKFIRSSPPVLSLAPDTSPIRSSYLEQHAAANAATKFSITYSYMRSGVYFDMDPAKVVPADLEDPVLKSFTQESPHVVFTDKIKVLAGRIVGDETNSWRVAKAFYDWIGSNIKYSYAREYSTLTNISDYCLCNRYGDCGQEAMLFITLCRSRGIPARWQTGWDLYPNFHDIHDWTEIYLAPYGWVPVDPWAGLFATRYCTSLSPAQRRELHDFYFGGLDFYRMAANADHSQELDPPKRTLRSDDVDFQRGELETSTSNLYFDKYSYHMDVHEFGCPPFSAEDIKNVSALAGKLARQSDPVSGFIWQKLLPSEQSTLKKCDSSEQNLKKAKLVLVEKLNDLMEIGSASIYEGQRFAAVSLPQEAHDLLGKNPTDADLSRLNRLLIEAAYPSELTHTQE